MMLTFAYIFALAASTPQDTTPLVIRGATVIDVSDYGNSTRDLRDAVVIVRDGKIAAVGPRRSTPVPTGARIIEAAGKYLVPGYIDGFSALANQAFANAHLYMGVTSVVAQLPPTAPVAPDARRPPTYTSANPSPRVALMGVISGAIRAVGQPPRYATPDEVVAQLDSLAGAGAKVMLLHYRVTPEALRSAVARARELGVATIGELGRSTYYEAQDAGVDLFVHTSRYSLEAAPPDLRARVASQPFGPPRTEYYRYLASLPGGDTAVTRHAARLSRGRSLLMPTLSLIYLMLPEHANPWLEPVARIIDSALIHLPADRVSGKPAAPADTVRDAFPPRTAEAMLALERAYARAGARYLTGSGVTAFGTMPGISLHTELELLVRAGLTPRQALAAATWNFSRLAPWSSLGEIAPGRDADMVLLDADPTRNIANAKRIATVVLRGSVLDREALLSRSRAGAWEGQAPRSTGAIRWSTRPM